MDSGARGNDGSCQPNYKTTINLAFAPDQQRSVIPAKTIIQRDEQFVIDLAVCYKTNAALSFCKGVGINAKSREKKETSCDAVLLVME
jgi:hypothetical protein